MNEKDILQNLVTDALKSAVKDEKLPDLQYPVVKIEYPKDKKFGDYATPIAMESARVARKSPLEIGETLKDYLNDSDILDGVDVVKPGFINMHISFDHLCKNLHTVIEEKDHYGRNEKKNPNKINIEFVSANPTGPMNIVSARAAAIGDTIANLLEATGDSVDREFYVNDFGNQVNLLGQSVLARYRELNNKDFIFPEEGYHGEYIKDIAAYLYKNHKSEIESIDGEEELISFCSKKAVEYNVGGQKKDLENFNVTFKNWFHEKSLHEKNEVEETYKFMDSKGVIFEEEGKKFFKSTDYGDDKDRVVIRDDGRPTYLLADIAYHRDKINRGYDSIINIWGPDHHGYIARLKGAVLAMGLEEKRFNILISQQVNLLMEGQTVKMSKRLGKFSTMNELVDEIGVDVSRYFFVMRSLESHLDFDLALAKKESSENPVFYLQYAHARICSIFNEAKKRNIEYNAQKGNNRHLDKAEAIILMKQMLKFPEEIADAAENYEPHRIATYLMRLAQAFHKFYTVHRVLTDNSEERNSYLTLSDAVRIVLKNGLCLLGVSTPEKM